MKILQIVPTISNESSGPSYSVPGLCRGLLSACCDVELHFVGKKPDRNFLFPISVSPIRPFPAARLGRSPEMKKKLLAAAEHADIIHNNSFWMFPNVYGYKAIQALRRAGKKAPKLVNAPRGTLAAWSLKHHWLQKGLFGRFAGQYAAMRATDMWHATCEKEYEEIRAAGFKQPVAIVPIGMDVPEISSKFKVQGSKFKVQGSRFKVQSEERGVQSSRFKVQSSKFKVQSEERGVQGSEKIGGENRWTEEAPLSTSTSFLHLTKNMPTTVHLHLISPPHKKNEPPLSTSTSTSLLFSKNKSPLKSTPLHRVVFFGRLHTVKRVDMLLRAWEMIVGGLECGGGETRCVDRRAMAEKKVAEWLEGVDDASFEAALVKLVEEKSAEGEYRFKKPEDRELAIEGARKFYREFSRKIVPLSDGRYVYFAPDERAKMRNASNAISWAEYAFHAVSNGGAKVFGKNYNERWFNPYKQPAFAMIESVLIREKCFIRLSSAGARFHAIVFADVENESSRLQVVTRLDDAGNIDANLSEVTFTASHKGKKSPRLVPLTEAVRTVVHYQTAAGSYPPNDDSVTFSEKGDKGEDPPPKFRPLTEVVEAVAKHQAAGFSPSTTVKSISNHCGADKGEGEVQGSEKIGGENRWTEEAPLIASRNRNEPPLSTSTSFLFSKTEPPLSTSTSTSFLFSKTEPPLSTSTSFLFSKTEPPLSTSTSFLFSKNESWELLIAGPDGGVRAELEAYVASHHLPRVQFVGEINGPAKYDFLASADLYVLPSSTENFGITLAEALACGTPSLGSRGTPWKELNEYHCGSWGFDTAEELAVELRKLMALSDEERAAMGERGKELIRTNYSWEGVGQKMKAAYEWLLDPEGVAKPEWVRL